MKHLADYYNERVAAEDSNDFLKQVGHTEQGRSITNEQFDSMVASICDLAALGPEDDLLDLCCGNGVITYQLAAKVRSAVGADFSSALIAIAREHHQRDNLRYEVRNALDLEGVRNSEGGKFTKVVMYAALQHFRQADFEDLIRGVKSVCAEESIVLFGFIPEKGKQSLFYNTPKRKFDQIVRRLAGRDVMGTWWDKAFIAQTCEKLGMQCAFHDAGKGSKASRYRFDVKIW